MKDLNLYLVRHGQTEWNLQDLMQGSKNSPLTTDGVLGAKITGQYLQNTPFIKAYSSPQQRAVETREYIINENNLRIPVTELVGLKEMDFGVWEGKHVPELQKIPEFNLYMNEPAEFDAAINQGENYLDVLARMQNSLTEIVNETTQDSGNILVVSHGTALRLLICVLNGGDWHHHRNEDYFPRMLNTSISLINYQQASDSEQGKFTVKFFNNVDHLSI